MKSDCWPYNCVGGFGIAGHLFTGGYRALFPSKHSQHDVTIGTTTTATAASSRKKKVSTKDSSLAKVKDVAASVEISSPAKSTRSHDSKSKAAAAKRLPESEQFSKVITQSQVEALNEIPPIIAKNDLGDDDNDKDDGQESSNPPFDNPQDERKKEALDFSFCVMTV